MKNMNVLSCFDGISCGRVALDKAGIPYDQYFASEIDKHAIKVATNNYPDTIQLGSVVDVDVSKLPPIGWLMGGSPCQSFSFAGKRKGMSTKDDILILTLDHYLELKEQGYEFEGQSYLFWEYMRILTDIRKYNPDVIFFLENVEMGKRWENILSRSIGVSGIHINSALVSAQSRPRIYWTNIAIKPMGLFGEPTSTIPQPKDRFIFLKDVLESDVNEKYYLSDKMYDWLTRHSEKRGSKFKKLDGSSKASCLTTTEAKQNLSNDYIITDPICAASMGRNPDNPKSRQAGLETEQMLEPRYDGKTNCLTSVAKDNYVVEGVNEVVQINADKQYGSQPQQQNRVYDSIGKSPCLSTDPRSPAIVENGIIEIGNIYDNGHNSVGGRVYSIDGKAACRRGKDEGLYAMEHPVEYKQRIRRLTEIECERLQTLPDNYTTGISGTQRYRCLGNGWNVETIVHIFNYYK